MISIVIGGMDSGKSEYAENLVRRLLRGTDDDKGATIRGCYLATMIPYGEFGRKKIEKHRAMRSDMELETVEDPYLDNIGAIEEADIILLEDLSNLIANYMFERKADYRTSLDSLIKLGDGIGKELIIVALRLDENEKADGGAGDKYDEQTKKYISTMNEAIEYICSKSDFVAEMTEGQAVIKKDRRSN